MATTEDNAVSTLELINAKAKELPPEKQRQVLDYVESLRTKESTAHRGRRRDDAEDEDDIAAARAALAESDERIPYEQVRRELGLTK